VSGCVGDNLCIESEDGDIFSIVIPEFFLNRKYSLMTVDKRFSEGSLGLNAILNFI
jgi:hypothetical protein